MLFINVYFIGHYYKLVNQFPTTLPDKSFRREGNAVNKDRLFFTVQDKEREVLSDDVTSREHERTFKGAGQPIGKSI